MEIEIIELHNRKNASDFFQNNKKKIRIDQVKIILNKLIVSYNYVETKNTITKYDYFLCENTLNFYERISRKKSNKLASDIIFEFGEDQDRKNIVCFAIWEESCPYETILPLPEQFPDGCIFEQCIGNNDDRGSYVTFPDGKKIIAVEGFGMSPFEEIIKSDFKNKNDERFREAAK